MQYMMPAVPGRYTDTGYNKRASYRYGVHCCKYRIFQRSVSCCGYGGLTAYANKEMADKMTEKCLERSDSPYITYCMACRDRFVREGRESRHILELLYGINAANMPDISEKRYNRLELKEKLLKNIWNEELMMEKKIIPLHIQKMPSV